MSHAATKMAKAFPVDQYRQAFQEEAREILIELESTLLELNEHPEDSQLVGKAFRALHTIKGSGAMFGFEEVAVFTHNLENAFDEVRNGRLRVTSELVDLTLAALDQIKAMLGSATGLSIPDEACCRDIQARLLKLTRPEGPEDRAAILRPVEAPSDSGGKFTTWKISFTPGPDLLRNGAEPLLLLRELGQFGELQVIADTSAVGADLGTRSRAMLPPLGDAADKRDGAGGHRRRFPLRRG